MTMPPLIITDTRSLADFCQTLMGQDFIAIDTEFMRERHYFAQLCLVQIASADTAAAIDPLAEGLDLTPLFDLLDNPSITKVFHSGRQDIEIFYTLLGRVPAPIYDTQLAAQVCGYGEQVGYDRLVHGMLGITIDKSSRFTNWANRPLSDKQIAYALDDVIHLAHLYPILKATIEAAGRSSWVLEDMENLADHALYYTDPMEAWQKIKKQGSKRVRLNRLKYLAAWREEEAMRRNLPRGHLLKDETLLALADNNPKTVEAVKSIRGANNGLAGQVLEALKKAAATPQKDYPRGPKKPNSPAPQASVELLRVLLKHCAETHSVTPRMIASPDEIDSLARGSASGTGDNTKGGEENAIQALCGWRGEIFGDLALDLCAGRIALSSEGRRLKIHHL